MQVRHTTRDWLTLLARLCNAIVPKFVGAYLGFRMHGLHRILWGWQRLRISPWAIFLAEQGAMFEVQGKLHVGFSLKSDVPLPGKRRTGVAVKKNGVFRSGHDVHLVVGSTVHVSEGAEVVIGDRTMVNYDSAIIARQSIHIGADCAIAWNVTILDSHLHTITGVPYAKPVRIGSRVWIGHNVTILQGVTIGDGAIIGAHSLVNEDIPPYTMAVGAPAHVVKEHVTWTF